MNYHQNHCIHLLIFLWKLIRKKKLRKKSDQFHINFKSLYIKYIFMNDART